MQEVVYQPESAGPNWRGPILLVLPVLLIVIWISESDLEARLIFLAFATIFVVLAILGIRFYQARFTYPLRFDKTGISCLPFVERYGVDSIPWQEIDQINLFRGTYGSASPGPRWLCLTIRDGDFLQKLKRPIGEQVFGGDVNVLLNFDAKPEDIVMMAKKFHQQLG